MWPILADLSCLIPPQQFTSSPSRPQPLFFFSSWNTPAYSLPRGYCTGYYFYSECLTPPLSVDGPFSHFSSLLKVTCSKGMSSPTPCEVVFILPPNILSLSLGVFITFAVILYVFTCLLLFSALPTKMLALREQNLPFLVILVLPSL